MTINDRQRIKLNKPRSHKKWRGLFIVFDEFAEKYPNVDEDYLIDILTECVRGGDWCARQRIKDDIIELLND